MVTIHFHCKKKCYNTERKLKPIEKSYTGLELHDCNNKVLILKWTVPLNKQFDVIEH